MKTNVDLYCTKQNHEEIDKITKAFHAMTTQDIVTQGATSQTLLLKLKQYSNLYTSHGGGSALFQ